MNNYIIAVDPLVKENTVNATTEFTGTNNFYADEKMHNLLESGNINEYLNYVKYKHMYSDSNKPEEYSYDKNKYKKQMIDTIWNNIMILENRIKEFRLK